MPHQSAHAKTHRSGGLHCLHIYNCPTDSPFTNTTRPAHTLTSLRPRLGLRLREQASQQIDHRPPRLVHDADELGADLQQEYEHADDDERHPVAEAGLRQRGLQHSTDAEEGCDAVDDQHRLAVAEAELLQAMMQMPLVRLHERLLVHPAAHDREERIGQRHADDE